jgi:nucleoside-diphosphate-sugar epimerase
MTILITGSSSYLGINLIKYLESKNKEYIGIDICKPINKYCVKLDIQNKELHKRIKNKKISSIVHLAAISNKNDCQKNIKKCYDVNLLGTINLLNFANKIKIKKFIFASSEWVYESCEKNKIINCDTAIPLNFSNHYSFSKLLCENVILLNSINSIILRFGIIYGKRSEKNFSAVESIIHQFIKKDEVIIQSKKTSRSYIHIDDIIQSIYTSITNKALKNKIIDVQGPYLVSHGKIVDILKKKINRKKKIRELNPKNYNVRNILINPKDKVNLLFKSKINIKEGVKKILDEINKKSI